jgi:hypothetical protein
MGVQLRHQPHTIFPNKSRCLVSVLVIFKSVIDRQPSHPDVNTRLRRVPFRIQPPDRQVLQRPSRKQNHVHAVMKLLLTISQFAFSSRWTPHRFILAITMIWATPKAFTRHRGAGARALPSLAEPKPLASRSLVRRLLGEGWCFVIFSSDL